MADEEIAVGLTADNKDILKKFNEVSDASKNVASIIGGSVRMINGHLQSMVQHAQKVATVMVVAAAASGAASLEAAGQYRSLESSMANVATVADTSSMSLGRMTQEVRSMAREVPKVTEDLAAGLYEVNSSGFQGAQGLMVLEKASRFSVAGLTDTQTAVKGASSLLNAYGLSATQAGLVTDVMFKAVERGQMTAEEFTNNIGDWSAMAAGLDVPFQTASAAIATLTLGGERATTASTAFAASLRAFLRPTEEMTKAFQEQGFSSAETALATLGYEEALNRLWIASGRTLTGMGQFFSDSEAIRGVMPLVTTQMENFTQANVEFNDVAQTRGTVDRAMEKQMKSQAAQLQMLGNEWREFRYEIGELISPLLTVGLIISNTVLGGINDLPEPLRKVVAGLSIITPALIVLGGALAGTVIKMKLLDAAVRTLVANKIISSLPGVSALVAKWAQFGGLAGVVKRFFTTVVSGSTAARMALLKLTAQLALTVGVITAVAYMGYELQKSFADSKVKAEEFANSIASLDDVKSLDNLNQKLEDLRVNLSMLPQDMSFQQALLGSLQGMLPGVDNTIMENTANAAAIRNQILELQAFGETADRVAGRTGQRVNDVILDMQEMAAAGSSSLEKVLSIVRQQEEEMGREDGPDWDRIAELADQYDAAIVGLVSDMQILNSEQAAMGGAMGGTEESLTDVQRAARGAGTAAGDLAHDMAILADEASTTSDKMGALLDVMDLLTGKNINVAKAQADMGDSFRSLYGLIEEGGFSLDQWSEQGSRVVAALDDLRTRGLAYAESVYKQTGSSEAATQAITEMTTGLWALGGQMGLSSAELNQMLNLMGLMPRDIRTMFELIGTQPALNALGSVYGGLTALNGFVAQAAVNVRVGVAVGGVNKAFKTSDPDAIAGLNQQKSIDAQMKNSLGNFMQNLAKNLVPSGGGGGGGRRGGGGGGGGGAAPKWSMTPEQEATVMAALAKPAQNLLGKYLEASLRENHEAVMWRSANERFSAGGDRLAAKILKEADAAGGDPASELKDLTDTYLAAVKLIGKAEADAALQLYEDLDRYKQFLEEVTELKERQIRMEDFQFDQGEISAMQYMRILDARLAAEEQYSSEWISLFNERKRVEEEYKQEKEAESEQRREDLEDQLQKEETIFRNRRKLGEIDAATYRAWLVEKLNDFEKYTNEWMEIWSEIDSLDQRTKEVMDNMETSISDAITSVVRAISDPIMEATNLVSAFGDSTTLTFEQVSGFYDHMREGTQRWVDTLQALRNAGANQSFLQDLISQGPQSLSFAESILGMGAGGISFINDSMSQIEDLTSQFAQQYAAGAVGNVTTNGNIINLTIDQISLVFDPAGTTLTATDVQEAIQDALANVANLISTSGAS